MNNGQKSLSINETFIIEGVSSADVFSACTGFYTNHIFSCSGNTEIILGTNIITTNSPFSATTFYGDGSNLTGISTQDTFVTGGTYNSNTGIATFTNNTGGTFNVTGFSDSLSTQFTGGTVSGFTSFLNGISATTVSACTFIQTNELRNCDGNNQIQLLTGETIFNTNLIPNSDVTLDIGSPIKRFRNINTLSGTSSFWVSTTKVITPMLDLGLDSLGNTRQITADNSIIQNDVLLGGVY